MALILANKFYSLGLINSADDDYQHLANDFEHP